MSLRIGAERSVTPANYVYAKFFLQGTVQQLRTFSKSTSVLLRCYLFVT